MPFVTVRRLSVLLATMLVSLAIVDVGSSQDVFKRIDGKENNENLGSSVTRMGDIDGDRVEDFVVGSAGSGVLKGKVQAYSGASFSLIWEKSEPRFESYFARDLANLGDVDGDGINDLALGSPSVDAVWVMSGRDGSVLSQSFGEEGSSFGWSIDAIGDFDGDGRGDFVVGAPRDFFVPVGMGSAHILDRQGQVLLTLYGDAQSERFGDKVLGLDDVNQDGVPDLLIGDRSWSGTADSAGAAFVISGATGTELYRITGTVETELVGRAMSPLDDLDGDGIRDFVLSVGGGTEARSGVDGAVIYRIESSRFGYGGARWMDDIGDINNDGVIDFALGGGFLTYHSGRNGDVLSYELPYRIGGGGIVTGAYSPLGDLDGDGYPEWLNGAPEYDGPRRRQEDIGTAEVLRGRGAFVWARDRFLRSGESLDLKVRGNPNRLAAVVLEGLSGTDLFLPISLGALDSEGRWDLASILIPAGLEDLELSVRAYIEGASGGLDLSRLEEISFL